MNRKLDGLARAKWPAARQAANKRRLFIESLEKRRMLDADSQNPLLNFDVNDDGFVSPIDALHVINAINQFGSRPLGAILVTDPHPMVYLDVNGDQFSSPIDALLVINELNTATPGPIITLGLLQDSGASATDGISNDPAIHGSVALGASPIVSARMRVNHDEVFNLPIDASGNFDFDPRTMQAIADGVTRIGVAVEFAAGRSGIRHLQFTHDATPPSFVPPHLVTADDTGLSDSDNVTNVPSPRIELEAESGSQLSVELNGESLDDTISTGLWQKQLGPLGDGVYNVAAIAVDVAGNISRAVVPVPVTIDTLAPPAVQIDLAVTSDTGAKGDRQTGATRVTLLGSTEGNATVTLGAGGLSARAGSDGKVRLPGIELASGANPFIAHVVDLAGNIGPDSQTILTRIVEAGSSDPVVRWNNAALEAIRLDATDPVVTTRNLALLSLAMYDVVNAVEGTPSYLVALAPPQGMSPEAAVSSAAFEILRAQYPAQSGALRAVFDSAMSEIADDQSKSDGIAFGRSLAYAILAVRAGDGWDAYVESFGDTTPGRWRETAPMYAPATTPQWGYLQTFAIASADALLPSGPPALNSQAYADAVKDVAALGKAVGSSRTTDQTEIARFWSDGAGTLTPPGHWNAIASQVAQATGNSWGENARLFAELNAALGDAAIVAWDAKFTYDSWRPITAIHEADFDGNDQTSADPNWAPLLITPPFPEYVSGHSVFSATAAKILAQEFGSSMPFTASSLGLPGVQRSYTSFDQAAEEAGRSRVYGGIHFEFANQDGQAAGRAVAAEVLSRFGVQDDVTPPKVVFQSSSDIAVATNPVIEGWVVDNLSGIRSLLAAVDAGPFTAVGLDATGKFAFETQLSLTGTADGPHVVHFLATDQAGLSRNYDFQFALDTLAPKIALTSPAPESQLQAGSSIAGNADGTGSALTALAYQIDSGSVMPLAFSEAGDFLQALDLSKVAAGAHTLTVTARDAAGHSTSQTLNLQLAAPIPFRVSASSPKDEAVDIGTTVRPQVSFSRPVQAGSLSDANFFATDATGTKLPANIVVTQDGSLAWLYLNSPMPGASVISLHLRGDTILALGDGQPLDADGDGQAGGDSVMQFTTVSRTPLPGTSLSGRVVDPGDDLKPMTFDDIRAGADGVLFTADDAFLHPIAGVKVFVIGMEGSPAITDAQGNFHFDMVPAGDVKLAVDGRAATNAPSGLFYPEMVMDLRIAPGQANTVMGAMGSADEQIANRQRGEVYLPRLQQSILHNVSATAPTVIGVDALAAPKLTDQQRELLRIEIQPGSLLDENGQPIAAGQVGISAVPPELVRDMLPAGVLQHTFDITIQAPGVSNFSVPAKLTFPNVFHSAPGTKLSFLSFDHTTGRLVLNGTATVSEDGLSVTTDPGQGVLHPGWHGLAPDGGPSGPDGPDGPPEPIDPATCSADGEGEDPYHSCRTVYEDPVALPLITREKGDVIDLSALRWVPPVSKKDKLTVEIEVDGQLKEFMKRTGTRDLATQKAFAVKKPESFKAVAKNYDEIFGKGGFANLDSDQLYGAKIQVTETLQVAGLAPVRTVKTFYVYRWITATYAPETQVKSIAGKDNRQGNTAAFIKTLNDGIGSVISEKAVTLKLPSTVKTQFAGLVGSTFNVLHDAAPGVSKPVWKFDPVNAGVVSSHLVIEVINPDLNAFTGTTLTSQIGEVNLRGRGIDPVSININLAGYKQELRELLTSPTRGIELAWHPGTDGKPGVAGVDDDGKNGKDDLGEYGWPNSDDEQVTLYQFGRTDPSLQQAIRPMALAGRATNSGHPTVNAFIIDPQFLIGHHAGNDGLEHTKDDQRYFNFVGSSPNFREEFKDFIPKERDDIGPDGVLHTADDSFSAQYLIDHGFDAFLDAKAAEMLAAVKADYDPVDDGHGAYRFVDTGGDVQMRWCDPFVTVSNGRACGGNASGKPVYGYAGFDADQRTDYDSDTITIAPILHDAKIPLVAKSWTLAEELNTHIAAEGTFGIAINIDFASDVSLAQFVANTVSHEVGHTFGLVDAYLDAPYKGAPGTAKCDTGHVCFPSDIMRLGNKLDSDLTFAPGNVLELKAAMGLADLTDLAPAVNQYRRTFNLAGNAGGIRDGSELFDEFGQPIEVPLSPLLIATTASSSWYGIGDDGPLVFSDTVADGLGGQAQTVTLNLFNTGLAPLEISSLSFPKGSVAFSLDNAAAVLHQPIAPNSGLPLVIRFDPAETGLVEDVLEIVSNSELTGTLSITLRGSSRANHPQLQAQTLNGNNLGGALVADETLVASELFRLINSGTQPLVIDAVSLFEGQGPFRLLGVPANIATEPITLLSGESFTFGARFDPENLGLARGLIDVHSNDPEHPTQRLSVVGTGVARVQLPKLGKDFIALDTPDREGSIALHTQSDAAGHFELFVPSSTFYQLSIFDPETGLLGSEGGMTGLSGQYTSLSSTTLFAASREADSDYDGLPDDIERAIGTSPRRADTDGNGLDDFTEIQQGLDPFGGRPIATGILGQLNLRGEAKQVVVEGATASNSAELAYVATGSFGLAIVDVSKFAQPVLLSELDLPGEATDVAVDASSGLAAIATGATGVQVVDITDPLVPRLLKTLDVATKQIELSNGVAYVAAGDSLKVYDLRLGLELDKLYFGSTIGGLAREGAFLYATTANNVLNIVDISGIALQRRGAISIGNGLQNDGALFVGGGIAYLMNTRDQFPFPSGGISTVDVSDPDAPRLIAPLELPPARLVQPAAGVAANGSGLAILVGAPQSSLGGPRSARLEVHDLRDPRDVDKLISTTLLPSIPAAVTTAGGVAFVADGAGGLVIVNYLPFDVDGIAPELSIPPDPHTGQTARLVTEGSPIRLPIRVSDDVQVRSVELLMADYVEVGDLNLNKFELVKSDVSFPFDVEATAPLVRPQDGLTRAVLMRVRVTDTGGNATLSAPVLVAITHDARPPVYFPRSFIDGSVRATGLKELSLFFSEPLRHDSVSPQTFRIVDSQNQLVTGFSAERVAGDAAVHLQFDPLPIGNYRLVIDSANVKDLSGYALGTSPLVTNFTVADVTENAWIGDLRFTATGNWHDPLNWSAGRVPGPTDIVSINIPTDKSIYFISGTSAVRNLSVTGGGLSLLGGTLTVNEASQLANLQISGGRLDGAADITITHAFVLNYGILSGTGELRIPEGATADFASNLSAVLDARRIVVQGRLNGVGSLSGALTYARAPTIEIQKQGVFHAESGFRMMSSDSLPGRIDLFGRFISDPGGDLVLGPEIVVMPGAEFAPQASRVEFQGGGRFNMALHTSADTIVYFRGPRDAAQPFPVYTFPAGITHQIDGPLLIGGSHIVLAGDVRVSDIDFIRDRSDFDSRNGVLIIDGTLSIGTQMGGHQGPLFGLSPFSLLGGGVIEGIGQVTIEPQALYVGTAQKFRGVTIFNRGTLDLSRNGFGLGNGAVFEHEGAIVQRADSDGSFSYAQISEAESPSDINVPFDRGTFNARVPLLFQGGMYFGAVLNVYAGLTVLNARPPISGLNNFPFVMRGGGTLHGLISIPRGVDFNLSAPGLAGSDPRNYSNTYTFAADSQIQIEGELHVLWSSLVVNTPVTTGMLHFVAYRNQGGTTVASNSITGPGNIDVTRLFLWNSGRLATTGRVTIKPTAVFQVEGTHFETVLDGTTLLHQGTSPADHTAGQITLAGGALFRNEGTFARIVYYTDILSGVGGGRIENAGDWVFGSGGGAFDQTTIDVPFINDGTLRINNPGNGAKDALQFSDLVNNGTLVLGAHLFDGRKAVEVRGDYHQSASAIFRAELSNTSPLYTQFFAGSLDVRGQAFLAGGLEVDFVSQDPKYFTDRPKAGESYPLLSFGSLVGGFTSFLDRDPDDGVTYDVITTSTSMTAKVTSDPPALRALGIPSIVGPFVPPTDLQLSQILTAATDRWMSIGLDQTDIDLLRTTKIRLADLDGDLLGRADQDSIAIDRDAAGWGWFVDAEPDNDDEFGLLCGDVLMAKDNREVSQRIDLLTVVLHELGHILGHRHEEADHGLSLMQESLATGIRKLPGKA